MKIITVWIVLLLLTGCSGMPQNVSPVNDFELDRYLGKWYEVARLDHSFERGLEKVTAEYAMRDDGGVTVVNRGYSVEDKAWQVADGRAYFVGDNSEGYLKVSFFGPFYGSYVVFYLDKEDYQYAAVSGPDNSYLWLLSRTPELSPEVIATFKAMAKARGFATKELIFVNH